MAPSKYYKQAVGTSQENMQKAKPVYNISWIIGNDDQGLESKILAAASLGFDASSVMKQVSRVSTFTSMLLYPFMQLEKELRYVDQSSACFMGCLR